MIVSNYYIDLKEFQLVYLKFNKLFNRFITKLSYLINLKFN